MAELTRKDIVVETIDKLKSHQQQTEQKHKRFIENAAVLLSITAVALSVVLFAYGKGVCSVYQIPVDCMPIDIKRFLPIAVQLCSINMYCLQYFVQHKTDRILGKNRISVTRILFGSCIILYLVKENNLLNVFDIIPCIVSSLILPALIELLNYLKRKPKKNKPIKEVERFIVMENMINSSLTYTYYYKCGLFILILAVAFAPLVGNISVQAQRDYQTFSIDDQQYAVIIDYDNKVLAQFININEGNLTIFTDSYRYIDKEGLVLQYNEYSQVVLNDGSEKEKTRIPDRVYNMLMILTNQVDQVPKEEIQ